jgi:hypothetical protein
MLFQSGRLCAEVTTFATLGEGNLSTGPATLKIESKHVLENQPTDEPERARESLSGWGLRSPGS